MTILEELNKKTKTELINLFEEMLQNGDLLKDNIEKYFLAQELSTYEQEIVDKLKSKQPLSNMNKEYISECLNKRQKTKVSTIFSGKNKFDSFIVEFKLKNYFDKAYSIYPRKVGKELGYKAFVKLLANVKYVDLSKYAQYILNKIQLYANQCAENETEEQFILHFATFCNSKKYLN
jgi:hypothetical protein